MSINSQTTDKLSSDTYPETPRLLKEGIVTIDNDSYTSSGGYSIGSASIDLSDFLDVGNRLKGDDPATVEIKVWKVIQVTGGGEVQDTYNPLPHTSFASYSTGEVEDYSYFEVANVYIIADGTTSTFLNIYNVEKSLGSHDRSFSYKIYSTQFNFDDTTT